VPPQAASAHRTSAHCRAAVIVQAPGVEAFRGDVSAESVLAKELAKGSSAPQKRQQRGHSGLTTAAYDAGDEIKRNP
jgi:hypothetical protein